MIAQLIRRAPAPRGSRSRMALSLALVVVSVTDRVPAQGEKPVTRTVGEAVAMVQKKGAAPLVECAFSADGSTSVLRSEDARVAFTAIAEHFGAVAGKADKEAAGDGSFRYGLSQMALSPDGTWLVARISPSALGVVTRRTASGNPRIKHQLRGMPGVAAYAFHPKGVQLIASMRDGLVRLWDVTSGRSLAYLPIQGTRHRWLGFLPDGLSILTLDVEQRLGSYGFPGGKKLGEATLPHPAKSMQLRPDGKQVAYAFESKVYVWDVEPLQEARSLAAGKPIARIAWSRDGKRLAVGQADGGVALFDAATGKVVYRWVPHPEKPIIGLQFMPPIKGKNVLVTAGHGDDVVYWDLDRLLQPAAGKGRQKRRRGR